MHPKLTKSSFIKWANNLSIDRQFSYVSNRECVLATWIRETLGLERVYCFPNSALIKGKRFIYPEWLNLLDCDFSMVGEGFEATVSANQIKQIAAKLNT